VRGSLFQKKVFLHSLLRMVQGSGVWEAWVGLKDGRVCAIARVEFILRTKKPHVVKASQVTVHSTKLHC
jgi:hypothetical protein